MIAEHMADRVAQGVYNYMRQMLKLSAYNEGVVNKLTADSITNLKLVVAPEDIISIKSMIQGKFANNVEVMPLAEMVKGMGGKVLTKKEQAVGEAQRSMQGVGMTPPKMPAMMPQVAAKQETPEAQAMKTLKIGFLGKSKEIQGQLSVLHAAMLKMFDVTKIEANLEVLTAAAKSCDDKIEASDVEVDVFFESEIGDFTSGIEDAIEEIKNALENFAEVVKCIPDDATAFVGTIDSAIAELP